MKRSWLMVTPAGVALVKKIAGFRAAAADIRDDMRKSSGMAKWSLWNDKRDVGADARAALLAYAFACDVPYRVVEPTARVRTPYTTEKGWREYLASRVTEALAEIDPRPDTRARVEAWLAVPETAERAEARQVERVAWFARRDVHRAEQAASRRQKGAA